MNTLAYPNLRYRNESQEKINFMFRDIINRFKVMLHFKKSDELKDTKIVFLDIDGVLCTRRSFFAFDTGNLMREWDITACAMVHRLCSSNGFKIVCSSTWRFDKDTINFFKDYGLYDFLHQDWRTGKDRESRGEEIKEWLNKHDVENFVIFDDDSDMLKYQMEKLILTNSSEGFSSKNFLDADKLMGGNFMKNRNK